MSLFSPIDPLLIVLYLAYRFRAWRPLLLTLGLIPAVLYSLPAQPCGCIVTPFVRCSGSGRDMAYLAAMKSDLRNLRSQQEIYYSDAGHYSVDFEALQFYASNGVDVRLVASADAWTARATHRALEGESCAMYFGRAPLPGFEELESAEPGAWVCTR